MKPKILIIEDDKPTIDLFEEVFSMAGFEIEVLDLGQKAIERLKEIREGKKEKTRFNFIRFNFAGYEWYFNFKRS